MRYTLSYDERLKKKIKKLDNGTKVILKKWIEKNLMDCEEPRSKGETSAWNFVKILEI